MFTKKIHLFAFLVLGFGFFNLNLIAQDEAADDVEEVIVDSGAAKGQSQPIIVHSKGDSKSKSGKTTAA